MRRHCHRLGVDGCLVDRAIMRLTESRGKFGLIFISLFGLWVENSREIARGGFSGCGSTTRALEVKK